MGLIGDDGLVSISYSDVHAYVDATPMPRCGKRGVARQLRKRRRRYEMLWTIVMILLILWLLGIVTSYTMGGLIHILLVVAIVVVLIRVIQGRRPI